MNKDKIIGPVLIPDKLIYRNPNEFVNEPHYIKFSKGTIAELRAKFHENNHEKNLRINHNGEYIEGIILKRSFILEDKNKIGLPEEIKSLPNGTWILEYSIRNPEVIKMIKEKKVIGFSIETFLNYAEKSGIIDKKNVVEISSELLNQIFDNLLYQAAKGRLHLDISSSSVYTELELVKEWKSKFGYQFNIHSNDHFIDNEPHFHFDNKEKGIFCKISFSGVVKESRGTKTIPKNTLKILRQFINRPEIKRVLIELWNKNNPELKIE